MNDLPFSGAADTETVSASTSSAQFTLGAETDQVLITVDADVTAFIKFGPTAQTATIATANCHMGKGTAVFSKPAGHVNGAVILDSGTANVYVTPGLGE